MYNLTVAEAHTFYVGSGQWLVHNCDDKWAEISGVVRDALKSKGNAGRGLIAEVDAPTIAESWVGTGYRVTKDAKGNEIWVSQDGLRQVRLPSNKPDLNKVQMNLEKRENSSQQWQSNYHLDVTK